MSETDLHIDTLPEEMNKVVNALCREFRRLWRALKKALDPFFKWLGSAHLRRWLKNAITAMRRAGIIEPRRRSVSPKRARIYQRKVGIAK